MEPQHQQRMALLTLLVITLMLMVFTSVHATPVHQHPSVNAKFHPTQVINRIYPLISGEQNQDMHQYCEQVSHQAALTLTQVTFDEQTQQGQCVLEGEVQWLAPVRKTTARIAQNQQPQHLRGAALNADSVYQFCDSRTRTTQTYHYQPHERDIALGHNTVHVRCFTPDTYAIGARWINLTLAVIGDETLTCTEGVLIDERCQQSGATEYHDFQLVTQIVPPFYSCPPQAHPDFTELEQAHCTNITRLQSPLNEQFNNTQQAASADGNRLGHYVITVVGLLTGISALTVVAKRI